MKVICSLLPGAETPILFSEYSEDEEEDSVELENDDDTENEEIFKESVVTKDTNGDVTSLPQSTKKFMERLTVECDPVSNTNIFILFYFE